MSRNMEDVSYELVFDATGEYFRRIPKKRHSSISPKNMPKEFLDVLFDITGDLDLSNYVPARSPERSEDENERCICGHVITELCYIKHKHTDAVIQVGNECIAKISSDLGKALRNGTCKRCNKFLLDMRTNHAKKGFCSLSCLIITEQLSSPITPTPSSISSSPSSPIDSVTSHRSLTIVTPKPNQIAFCKCGSRKGRNPRTNLYYINCYNCFKKN